ncbi:hypothetical protein HOD75_05065 [archaeon]|nr:hypothetical protein [archaeon]MBT4242236.1 hypothetical protein [archaeon]
MRVEKKRLLLFSVSLLLAFVYWRLLVMNFVNLSEVSFLRGITGLNFHHYHYGILVLLLMFLFIMFFKINSFIVVLAGFGFGTYFDGFLSRLFSSSNRYGELMNYHNNFFSSLIFFICIILVSFIFYKISLNGEK